MSTPADPLPSPRPDPVASPGVDARSPAPSPAPAPAPSPAGAAPDRRRRERSTGHIVAIVIGALALLPALGILTGGIGLAVANAVVADDDGYYGYTLDRVETSGIAVAATDLWLDDADGETPWVFDWLDVDLRLRVSGAGATEDVFVGVARTADVERYLDGTAWSEVIELDGRIARTADVAGVGEIGAPGDLDIWTAAIEGPGEQELTWRARGGRWSIVVMNADGTAGVAADVELGARSGAVTPIAVTMIAVGGVLVIGAIVLVVFGARGRRIDGRPFGTGGTGAAADPLAPGGLGSDVAPVSPPGPAAPATTSSADAPLPPPVATTDDRDPVPLG